LSPREDADDRLHKTEKGVAIMPGPNLLACFREGGKFFKQGRSKVTTQKSSLVPACLGIDEMYVDIASKGGWKVDTRPVRIPATGGRILRHRPCFDDWTLKFSITLDTDVLGVNLVRDIVDTAGKRVGLCDFRPDCRGPFGRFRVDHWSVGK
jgi:hypothetical protein